MINCPICETLLQAYKDQKKVCERLDEIVTRIALNSRNADGYETANKIISLTAEKIAYLDIRMIVGNALRAVGNTYEFEQHYLKGYTIIEVARDINRSIDVANDRLCKQKKKLFDTILKEHKEEYLIELISNSKHLMAVYIEEQNKAVAKAKRYGKDS